jgi:cell division protein FtsW
MIAVDTKAVSQIATIILIALAILLTAAGTVMVSSTSNYSKVAEGKLPTQRLENSLVKQVALVTLALVIGSIVVACDYRLLRRCTWYLYGATSFLLIVCVLQSPEAATNGAKRWLKYGNYTFQVSELAKVAMCVVIAHIMADGSNAKSIWRGFFMPMAWVTGLAVLILIEPDLGTFVLFIVAAVITLYLAGCPWWLPALAAGSAVVCTVVVLTLAEKFAKSPDSFYRVRAQRIVAFQNPEDYKEEARQQVQSKVAIGVGKFYGVGLGNSERKKHFLAEAHTDFVLAVIGEEFGLRGTGAIICGMFLVALCGFVIAASTDDRFGSVLAYGLSTVLALQGLINMAMVMSCLPNKGMPLPFVSYGGSNLLFCLGTVGVLASIQLHRQPAQKNPKSEKKHRAEFRKRPTKRM